jgi:hypothetical protein
MDPREASLELYHHSKRAEWGLAILAWDQGNRRGFQFQDGVLRVISEGYYALLRPVTEPPEGAAQLIADLRQRAGMAEERARSKASGARLTFSDQLKIFRIKYPGGFTDDGWARGGDGRRLKKHRQPAIDDAQAALADEALQAALTGQRCAEVIEALATLLGQTNLVKPKEVEGVRQLPIERAEPVVAALRELLHGEEAAIGPRFDRLAAELHGQFSWALTTAPGALARPEVLAYVHPPTIQRQAQVLEPLFSLRVHPNGHAYGRAVALTTRVRDLVMEAGLQPADLLDVYDFMAATLMPSSLKLLEGCS